MAMSFYLLRSETVTAWTKMRDLKMKSKGTRRTCDIDEQNFGDRRVVCHQRFDQTARELELQFAKNSNILPT